MLNVNRIAAGTLGTFWDFFCYVFGTKTRWCFWGSAPTPYNFCRICYKLRYIKNITLCSVCTQARATLSITLITSPVGEAMRSSTILIHPNISPSLQHLLMASNGKHLLHINPLHVITQVTPRQINSTQQCLPPLSLPVFTMVSGCRGTPFCETKLRTDCGETCGWDEPPRRLSLQ